MWLCRHKLCFIVYFQKYLRRRFFNQLQSYLTENMILDIPIRVLQCTALGLPFWKSQMICCSQLTLRFFSSVFVLLDLTAAIDTVDQRVLLEQLKHCVGIKGIVLQRYWPLWSILMASVLVMMIYSSFLTALRILNTGWEITSSNLMKTRQRGLSLVPQSHLVHSHHTKKAFCANRKKGLTCSS